jgi:glutathione S-transferase
MDIVARVAGHPITAETKAQIDRILRIWTECRGTFAGGGDFLFGPVTIADCFYAPVATRFRTYGVALDGAARAYAEAVLAWPAVQEWTAEARREEELRARSR